MSRTSEVIKGRKKIEKELRKRKNEEVTKLRSSSSFRASAYEFFKEVSTLLEDDSIESVNIVIDDSDIANFGSMIIESHELDVFDIRQVKGKSNEFIVKKRYISI